MKFLKRLALPLAVMLLCTAVGCKKTEYHFYTNIAQGGYEVTEKSFKIGSTIGGYVSHDGEYEEVDTSGYSSKSRLYYSAMGADAQLVISYDFSKEGAEENYAEFTKAIYNLIDNADKALSSTIKDSDIYNFNNAAPGETIEISEITYGVLSTAQDVYNLTEGCYNPALYYNIHAYGFGGSYDFPESASQMPDDEIIEKYTDLASHFGDIRLSEEEGKFFVTKPEYTVEVEGEILTMKLDLGGIGKGYVVDRVDELFDMYGFKYGYFNFGASSMLVKSNVRDGNYTVELINPRSVKRDGYIKILARDEKLSTSGDNEKCFFIDGVRYCHIIDPATGKPVQKGIMSVTVIGGGAAEDDALTTAFMCMGKDKAIKFIEEKLTDRRVIFTTE